MFSVFYSHLVVSFISGLSLTLSWAACSHHWMLLHLPLGEGAGPAAGRLTQTLHGVRQELPQASYNEGFFFKKRGEFADDSRVTLRFLVPSFARIPLNWMMCFGFQSSFAIHLSPAGHASTFMGPGGEQNILAKATVPPSVMLEH